MLKDSINKFFDSKTPEEIEEIEKKYFTEPKIPRGWVSIVDHLPQFKAIDIFKGCSEYRVKLKDGSETISLVSDHVVWFELAKESGVTHWFNS